MSMKRIFTQMLILCLPLWATNIFAQDTIVGWTFPSTSADSIADFSAGTLNTTRYLSCQYGTWGKPSYHSIPTDYTTNGSLGTIDVSSTPVSGDILMQLTFTPIDADLKIVRVLRTSMIAT